MKLMAIVIGSIFLSMFLKTVVCFLFVQDYDEDQAYELAVNTIIIMVVNTLIPFVLGCAVGLYALG